VVLPCPACRELVVLFRRKVIGVNRAVLESGSREDRVQHIAEVIEQFMEPGLFSTPPSGFAMEAGAEAEGESELSFDGNGEDGSEPISKSELDEFLKFDLNRIDDATYFKRHFGE
jgi:hypothetical protein